MRGFDVMLKRVVCSRCGAGIGEMDREASGVDIIGRWQRIVQTYSTFTPPFDTTGQPAILLLLWQAIFGLPLAMQSIGRAGDQETLYSVAGQLEQALLWSGGRPPYYA